jgi:ferrochelatase
MTERLGLLVMAYGTPRTLDDVEAYYTDIRRGRPPSAEQLNQLKDRYRAIGGGSPLLEITTRQAAGLAERLGIPAYLGMKHAPPTIAEAVEQMVRDEIERAAGLVLAPHYSVMSIGDYRKRAERAAEQLGWGGKLEMIESWHLEPGYIDFLAREVNAALGRIAVDASVVFTAHSLPTRIVQAGDPYAEQLVETAEAVARRAGLEKWSTAWQSAGRSDVPWLGPDVSEVIQQLARGGTAGVVLCPCGFVADHLEVLYDIDFECASIASEIGIAFERTVSPNEDPDFLDALANVVAQALSLHR